MAGRRRSRAGRRASRRLRGASPSPLPERSSPARSSRSAPAGPAPPAAGTCSKPSSCANGILRIRSTLVRVASAVVTQAAAAPVGPRRPHRAAGRHRLLGAGTAAGAPDAPDARSWWAAAWRPASRAPTTRQSAPPCLPARFCSGRSRSTSSRPGRVVGHGDRARHGRRSGARRSSPSRHWRWPARGNWCCTPCSACSAAPWRPCSCWRCAQAPPSSPAHGCRARWRWRRPRSWSAS